MEQLVSLLDYITAAPAMVWGLAAVVVHITAYIVYVIKSLRYEIEPNATTWFLCAAGTIVIAFAERDLGAHGYQLWLLYVCTVSSAIVAIICLWLARFRISLPEHGSDRAALYLDLVLIAAYASTFALYRHGSISDDLRYLALVILLVLLNWSTLVTFRPILRDAKLNPDREHSAAWILWALAYALLTLATVRGFQEGDSQDMLMGTLFMLYPLVSLYLHSKMAWLARQGRHGGRKVTRYSAPS